MLGTLLLVFLPVAFNRYVLPFVSERARLRKYLKVINAAAETYRSQFVGQFDDGDIVWADHAQQVLVAAAKAEPLPPNDKTWALAQRIFLNYGPGLEVPQVLEP